MAIVIILAIKIVMAAIIVKAFLVSNQLFKVYKIDEHLNQK